MRTSVTSRDTTDGLEELLAVIGWCLDRALLVDDETARAIHALAGGGLTRIHAVIAEARPVPGGRRPVPGGAARSLPGSSRALAA